MTPKFLIPIVDIVINETRKISHSFNLQMRRWQFNPHKLRRVLVNKLDPGNGIGDYIQSSALVTALKDASPNVEINFLVSGKEDLVVFELFPYLVSVINLHPSNINYNDLSEFAETRLHPKKFDLVIHGWGENLAFAKVITQKGGFLNSMGYYKKESLGQLPVFTITLPFLTAPRPFSYDYYLKKILDVKLEWKAVLDRNLLKSGDIEGKNEKGRIILGIHPGCKSNRKETRWPIKNFKDIAIWFHNQIGGKVLVFGGPDEEEDVRNLTDEIGDGDFQAILNQPLLEVAKLISKCNMFVSNDSGLMNLSMALGVPSIGICGPTDMRSLENIYPNAVFLGEKMPCCPCYNNSHYLSCIENLNDNVKCFELIKPDKVIEKIKELHLNMHDK